MTNRARSLLRLPQGTEGFYLDEAYRHRRLTLQIENLLYRWGYLPVQTPVFDFFDAYEPLFRSDDVRNIYRLIDREGDLLMLRSDITLFLARQMGMILTEEDLPIRVCYFDTILRHQNAEDISKIEFFQIGAELIGKPGVHGDLEALVLLSDILDDVPLRSYVFHLGSRALFDAFFEGIVTAGRTQLIKAVTMREYPALHAVLEAAGVERDRARYLEQVFRYIGPFSGLSDLMETGKSRGFVPRGATVAAQEISGIWDALERLDRADRFRIDLSEIGNQPYYTGIVFQVYVDGVESGIASGGRYDNLLATFGFPAPSVGFSVMLRKVEMIMETPERYAPPESVKKITDEDFVAAYRRAADVRKSGEGAVIW